MKENILVWLVGCNWIFIRVFKNYFPYGNYEITMIVS